MTNDIEHRPAIRYEDPLHVEPTPITPVIRQGFEEDPE